MTHEQKRIFFNFLKKENLLIRYKRNRFLNNQDKRYRTTSYNDISFVFPFSNSFIWRHTVEGYSFWKQIQSKWIDYCCYDKQT